MPTIVRSYAKVNLGLRIGPVRADGFHELATVYQTIDLWDRVTVSAEPAAKTEIVIECQHPWVPRDARNTCWTAVRLGLEALDFPVAVTIRIDKRLPVQGGLGAGSANAVAALLGLERELARLGCARRLSGQARLALAERVGSDVPLFAVGGTVFGFGRGEQVLPLEDSPELPTLVVLPNERVSTPQAFREWDALASATGNPPESANPGTPEAGSALTRSRDPGRINELSRAVAAVWASAGSSGVFSAGEDLAGNPVLALVHTGIENDFERVVFPQHPLLRDLKAALAGDTPGTSHNEKAVAAMLSGSGSALFGLYANDTAADAAAKRVEAVGATVLRTSTISRRRYWAEMVEQ